MNCKYRPGQTVVVKNVKNPSAVGYLGTSHTVCDYIKTPNLIKYSKDGEPIYLCRSENGNYTWFHESEFTELSLTDKEKELICKAALDIATGNYLLCKRTEEELRMLKEVNKAIYTPEEKRTERQKDIYEEYLCCTDYNYAKSKGRA